jgi:predicted O-methyltransferase YrrM
LEWSLRLSRPGTIIITDNVIREGAVIDPDDPDPRVQGVRRFFKMIAADPRIDATTLQTVGSKGYDGFTLAIVKSVA